MKRKAKRITAKRVQESENDPAPVATLTFQPERDEGEWDNDGLNTRQRAFVDALIGPAGGNASKAAEIAGYAAENRNALRVTAHHLLIKPNVQECLARALARRRLTPEWAQERLAELASASMRNFVNIDEAGKLSVDWNKAKAAGAIGQIREIREEVTEVDGVAVQIVKRTFKLHDPTKPLELILRLSGLLKDETTVRLTGHDGGPVKTKQVISFEELRDSYKRFRGDGNRVASPDDN